MDKSQYEEPFSADRISRVARDYLLLVWSGVVSLFSTYIATECAFSIAWIVRRLSRHFCHRCIL